MNTDEITFYCDGMKLSAAVDFPEGKGRLKFIVACHGLFSTKDSDKWRGLGERLTGAGYGVLRLDFRGCGASEGLIEESTVSGRLRDLAEAITCIKRLPSFTPPMGLVGSSLGGFLAMVEASANPEIGAVAAMATPAAIEASQEVEVSLRDKGYYQYPEFRLNKGFWENGGRYPLTSIASKISCPTLLIHGDKDEQVPPESALKLYASLGCEKRLEMIDGGDHIFSEPADRGKVVCLVVNWFLRYMAP